MMTQYITELQQQLHASWASLEARGGGLTSLCRFSSPAPGDERGGSSSGPGSAAEGLPAVLAAVTAAASGALGAAWAALAAGCWRLLELGGALYLSMRYFTGAGGLGGRPSPSFRRCSGRRRTVRCPIAAYCAPLPSRCRSHMLAAVWLHLLQRAGAAPAPAAVPFVDHLPCWAPRRGLLTCVRCTGIESCMCQSAAFHALVECRKGVSLLLWKAGACLCITPRSCQKPAFFLVTHTVSAGVPWLLRRCPLYWGQASYFKGSELVKTADLDPSKRYVFAGEQHSGAAFTSHLCVLGARLAVAAGDAGQHAWLASTPKLQGSLV